MNAVQMFKDGNLEPVPNYTTNKAQPSHTHAFFPLLCLYTLFRV